jgi:hypothetical protein
LQIRRLAAKARAVIDNLAIDLSRCVVNECHRDFGLAEFLTPEPSGIPGFWS